MKRIILTITAAVLLSGCATQQLVKTEPQQQHMYFPSPAEPKIEYIGTYQHSGNLEKESSGLDAFFGAATNVETVIHNAPYNIAASNINGQHLVYVTDINRNDVVRWDFTNKTVRVFGSGYANPTGVATDSAGNVYISDRDTKKVFVFFPDEKLSHTIDLSQHVKSALNIAIDSKLRHIIIADSDGYVVSVFDFAGKFLLQIGKVAPYDGPDEYLAERYKGQLIGSNYDGEFNRPVAVAVDRQTSDILVADTFNYRVQRFDKNGKFLSKIGTYGDGPGQFGVVKGVNTDSDGNIYITDGQYHRMSIFDKNGDLLFVMGDINTSKKGDNGGTVFAANSFAKNGKEFIGGFIMPQGVYIDDKDRIYVADSMNHGWQQFQYLKNGNDNKSLPEK